MKYMTPLFVLLLIGCTDTPDPQSEREMMAKVTIEKNMDEAQKARAEYIALQKKRQADGTL
jgi:hypothetical protein